MTAVVLRLVESNNEETVITLEWMLGQARKDPRFNFCGAIRDGSGDERPVITGLYRSDRSKAVHASMRLAKHLLGEHDS